MFCRDSFVGGVYVMGKCSLHCKALSCMGMLTGTAGARTVQSTTTSNLLRPPFYENVVCVSTRCKTIIMYGNDKWCLVLLNVLFVL